ncbi:MAG: lipoyl(octanoyl) transferase LipB [candidate division KSB1 bacterium]|nr:lipoyl(octanoyl) transferase LipB [candidate division KSB1 bacterium]
MPEERRSTSEGRPGILWVWGPRTMEYRAAWDLQRSLFSARTRGEIPDTLLLLEHPPVFTIGRSGGQGDFRLPASRLSGLGIPVIECDRGGRVTFHGPGQLVGYPILDLAQHRRDVHWYLRTIEEVLIVTLDQFGIRAQRRPGLTGVWVDEQKIAAIGIKVSRWVTMHGFALNVATDLHHFNYIVPCGIRNLGVTSMARVLGHKVDLLEVADACVRAFAERFGFAEYRYVSGDLLALLKVGGSSVTAGEQNP